MTFCYFWFVYRMLNEEKTQLMNRLIEIEKEVDSV
jgi:hypothetical protein